MEELNHQGWIDQIPVTILLKRNKAKQVEIITRRRKAKKTVNVREANHPSKCLDVMYLPLQRNDRQKNDHQIMIIIIIITITRKTIKHYRHHQLLKINYIIQ